MSLTPSTIRADLKCGKGSISEGEKCTKGAARRVQPLNKFVQIPKDYPGRKQPYGPGFRSKTENALIASGGAITAAAAVANVADLITPIGYGTTRFPYAKVAASVGSTLTGIGLATKAQRLSKGTEGKPVSKTQKRQNERLRKRATYALATGALAGALAYSTYKQGKRLRQIHQQNFQPERFYSVKNNIKRQQLENLYASSASQSTRNKQNFFGVLASAKGRITQAGQRRRLERLVKRRDSIWATGFAP